MTTVRILHISDSHGHFWEPHGRYDVVVHSGDIFPNVTRGNRYVEERYQLEQLRKNGEGFRRWANGCPFVFCLGNHDFLDPEIVETELREMGVVAFNVTDQARDICGMKFRGFPWVPRIEGEWNFEVTEQEIADKLKRVDVPDVMVAHGPIAGVLDVTFDRKPHGSSAMANWIAYKNAKQPKAYLCGHMHDSFGVRSEIGMLISNAATTMNLIEVST